MNLDFSPDQKLIQETARQFLAERAPLSVCRRILESKGEGEAYAAELWSAIASMGWLGTAIPERFGGAGYGPLELALLCGELGRALAPVPFFSSVVLFGEALQIAGSAEQQRAWLPSIASGERIGTLAVAERVGPLSRDGKLRLETRLVGERLFGTKLAVPDAGAADVCAVLAQSEVGPTLVLVELAEQGVKREVVAGIDPSRPVARLHFDGARAQTLGERGMGGRSLERLWRRAAVLAAFEQLGGAERALELTRDFTLGRFAFGRPVASYQALKHRLVDVFVALELARSHAYYAVWALSVEADSLEEAACSARVSASEAFERAATEMIQLHGGVGYTWEMDCQLFYRRAKGLAASLGGMREWKLRLTAALAQSGQGVAAAQGTPARRDG